MPPYFELLHPHKPMSTIALPPNHRRETLTPYSPAVYGRLCAVTGEPLRPGDEVVVCDAIPGSDPMLIEGWTTQGSCPHCGVATGSIVYVPPVWGLPAAPTVALPPPPPQRSRALVGGVAGLLLPALTALAVAVFLFVIRTRPTAEPPAATLSIAALTATAITGPTNATATPAAPDGAYTLRWYDPRTGEFVGQPTATTATDGALPLGPPPRDPAADWVALVTAAAFAPPTPAAYP